MIEFHELLRRRLLGLESGFKPLFSVKFRGGGDSGALIVTMRGCDSAAVSVRWPFGGDVYEVLGYFGYDFELPSKLVVSFADPACADLVVGEVLRLFGVSLDEVGLGAYVGECDDGV